MKRTSPVDNPTKKLKAILAAQDRLEKAALAYAHFEETCIKNGHYALADLYDPEQELLRAAKALRKARGLSGD
jgi:hypothetical protein